LIVLDVKATTLGGSVSMTMSLRKPIELTAPGTARVRSASLPAVSRIELAASTISDALSK
jgi:hypothetical protein